jgi:signal transduction histidine kinase
VIDQGCGIPAHFIRSELFKPFKTTKSQGLGIGLYQCRKVVEAHGGRIEVRSQEGKGSVFTVWFAES